MVNPTYAVVDYDDLLGRHLAHSLLEEYSLITWLLEKAVFQIN
jgi:hypothetical protein